jgi:hypothetical protein
MTALVYSSAQSLTITPASLASAGWRMSDAVDNNATNNYIDCHVGGLIRVGTLAATGYLAIYAYGTYDGTEYTAGLNGAADATITWGTTGRSGLLSYLNLPLLGLVTTDATDDDDYVTWGPYSVAGAFGILMPRKWGIVIYNGTGAALQATQTSSEAQYTGITLG